MTRRRPVAVLALAVSLVLVTSSGGFTTAASERTVQIASGADDSALLTVESAAPELPNGNHRDVTLLTITNRFPAAIVDVDASVRSAGHPSPPRLTGHGVQPPPTPVGIGESVAVTASVTCGANPPGSDRFTIRLAATTAGGSSVELERNVTVVCTGEPNRGESGRDRSKPDGATRSTSNPGNAD
ncbi:hypothetical protein OB920_17610 [Halobacteria archaeon HArc-gm2]|nr:hypothetical protein [Halobacteria archaeon HArc-gm2]